MRFEGRPPSTAYDRDRLKVVALPRSVDIMIGPNTGPLTFTRL